MVLVVANSKRIKAITNVRSNRLLFINLTKRQDLIKRGCHRILILLPLSRLTEGFLIAETLPFCICISRYIGRKAQAGRINECSELMNGVSMPKDKEIKRKLCCFRRMFQYHFPL